MTDERRTVSTAIEMMIDALALLDEAGETIAAAHLAHAIAVATREPVPTLIEPASN